MSQLPVEVLADILSRLPHKSIVRFRSVSTSWLSLIDSYGFLKSRLNGSVRTNTVVSLMLREAGRFQWINFCSHDDIIPTVHGELLSQYNCNEIKIYGSCNGLVCFSDQSKNFALWNPLTGKCQKITPSLCDLQSDEDVEVYGFGYDTINDDYKVVKIVYTTSNYYLDPCDHVMVYSSKSNSWHKAESILYGHYVRPRDGILVSGALHWAMDESRYSYKLAYIISFDLSSEQYRLVDPPIYDLPDPGYYLKLRSLGGCLAVICYNYRAGYNIWVMKDYGVRESWTKLVYMLDLRAAEIGFYYAIAYSKDGSEVLVHDPCHNLLWFDLKRKKFAPFLVDGMENLGGTETWLVSAVQDNGDRADVSLSSAVHPGSTKKRIQFFSKSLGVWRLGEIMKNWKNRILKKDLK